MNPLSNQKMKTITKWCLRIWVKAGKYLQLKIFCKIQEMKTFKLQIIKFLIKKQGFLQQENPKKNSNKL